MRASLVGLNVGGNPPLGLGYLKAYAEANGNLRSEVDICIRSHDYFVAPETVVIDIVRDAPRVVGVNVMHGNMRKVLRIAEGIKVFLPESIVVLGGVEAGPSAERLLAASPSVDLVVFGEGEVTFAEILAAACAGGALPAIAGTVVREEGKPVRRPERPVVDLSTVPSPYLSGALDAESFDAVHIETYRGCAYHCAFCYEGRGFAGPRQFPEEQVFAELEYLLAKEPRPTKFYDTTFNQFRGRTLRILDYLARRNARGHTFGAEVRMEAFDREMSEAARRAGLVDIETGLQSIRTDTLSVLGRTGDRCAFETNVRDALLAGLRVIVHIMGGLPGDRLSDTFRAHDYVLSLGAEPCLFHTRILPGTALHDQAQQGGIVFVEEPNYDVLKHETFSLSDYERYNRFGLARAVLGPCIDVIHRLGERQGRSVAALIEELTQALDDCSSWRSLVARRRWWDAGADPAFSAEVSLLRDECHDRILDWVERQSADLPPFERSALLALFRYFCIFDRVRRAPAPHQPHGRFCRLGRWRLAPHVAFFRASMDIGPLLGRDNVPLSHLTPKDTRLLLQRTSKGTVTKAINPEMERLLRLFSDPMSVRDAVVAWLSDQASADHAEQIRSVITTLFEEGTLIPDREPEELARGEHLVLRTLTAADEAAVVRVYQENHRFFQAIAGIDEPPYEHVKSDIEEGPPGYETHKSFLGIALVSTGELIGVADFVDGYPKTGEGCFGLLLLSERFQRRGLGREAADLVEGWALARYDVRRVSVGVEFVNEPARQFWRKQGYEPTGEHFMASALGRDNEAELLIKKLGPEIVDKP